MNSNHIIKKLLREGSVWLAGYNPCGVYESSFLGNAAYLRASFGISEIDDSLPDRGLAFGCLHEWALADGLSSKLPYRWTPPLFLVSAFLGQALRQNALGNFCLNKHKNLIVWAGRRCWPTPALLQKTSLTGVQIKSLFLDPRGKKQRLGSIKQILRSPSTIAVIADGSNFSMNASKALQLAARKGNSLGILLRPPWELSCPSGAHSKWMIQPVHSEPEKNSSAPYSSALSSVILEWQLELLHCKGSNTLNSSLFFKHTPDDKSSVSSKQEDIIRRSPARKWLIAWKEEQLNYGQGAICLSSAVSSIGSTRQNRIAAA